MKMLLHPLIATFAACHKVDYAKIRLYRYHVGKFVKSEDKKALKAQAHSLNPVVMIGQAGLTEAVSAEIDTALIAHELIKVKIRAEREERNEMAQVICATHQAELIQSIGQIVVIYRKNLKK
jgi:RNA-binding protein